LIGFYITVQAIFNYFLDFGLSATINREIARYSMSPEKNGEARSLVRTLEIGYWGIGVLLGLFLASASGYLAENWVIAENIPITTIQQTLAIMGMVVIFQWPLSFYQGALMGLQRLVLLNRLNAFAVTLRMLSTLIVLWFVSPTILAFFTWQIFASFVQVSVTAILLWKSMPHSENPDRFDLNLLKGVWKFAAGMSLTSFLSFFLSQADRIILSRLVTLEIFGYYTVAATANSALRIISSQITTALFPRFSALVARNDEGQLRELFHKGSQLVSAVVLPAALVASFFSFNLFAFWTQDPVIADASAPIASLLFLGTAINSLLGIPYNLTLAYGWSSLGVYQNLIAVAVATPLMFFLASRFGGVGAASAWVILNVGYLLFLPPVIHRFFLRKELGKWYLMDVGIPMVVAVILSALFWRFMPGQMPQLFSIAYIAIAGLVTLFCVALTLKEVRTMFLGMILKR
jgi:O-antigen/teichoic acid export membrane protein